MSSQAWSRPSSLVVVVAALCAPLAAQAPVETIGPWNIRAAPLSATLISGGGSIWDWLNTTNSPIDENTAFSGVSIVSDGFANADAGTIVEVVFASGALVNGAGNDLVMFDAQFSVNAYSISTSYDNFVAQWPLPGVAFSGTGVFPSYFYGGVGPYASQVLAAPVDLSNLGVPPGTSVDRVRFATTSSECDPLGVGSLCNPTCGGPSSYCTSGTTQHGCNASIGSSGTPSASGASAFQIVVSNVEGQRSGLVFYGISGPLALQWASGSSSWLCVKPPVQRTPVQSSAGTSGACDGTLGLDWNAFQTGNPGALGQPFQAGDVVNAQGWFRDPASPKATSLSDGLEFTMQP